MLKGLGKALQDAIDGSEKPLPSKPASATLLSVPRRRILEYLCLRPFSTIGRIASELKMSPSSVTWHLRELISAGYVMHRRETKVYYPKDFVDTEDFNLFIIAHAPKRGEILRQILDSPGITQSSLADATSISRQTAGKIALEFEKLELVIKVEDGRLVRWYPTDLLKYKQESQKARSRAYIEAFIERLEREGQTPQILRRTETEFQVRLGRGRDRGILSIPLDPYGALLS